MRKIIKICRQNGEKKQTMLWSTDVYPVIGEWNSENVARV